MAWVYPFTPTMCAPQPDDFLAFFYRLLPVIPVAFSSLMLLRFMVW
ncbi:hypothetical protein [Dickeya ananatis]